MKTVKRITRKTELDSFCRYLKSIFTESPIGIELYDAGGMLVEANRACLSIFGVRNVSGVKGFKLFEDPNLSTEAKKRLRKGKSVTYEAPFDFEEVKRHKLYRTDKSGTIHLQVIITPLRPGKRGALMGYLVQLQDITGRKVSEEKIHAQQVFLHTVIESITNPFYVIDVRDHSIKLSNTAARHSIETDCMTCYSLSHSRNKPCVSTPDHPCPLEMVRRSKKPIVVEHVHRDKDGNERFFEVHGHPVLDEKGDVAQMIEYSMDITERKRMEEGLRSLSLVDELTGLYNRRGFLTLVDKQLEIALRRKSRALIVFADIDNMKEINDTFGHAGGDMALLDINNLLRYTFRESDIIARIGGDEFVVFTVESGGKRREAGIRRRLQRNLERHNRFSNRPFRLSISTGFEHYDPSRPVAIYELLDRADRKMYAEKTIKRKKGYRVAR